MIITEKELTIRSKSSLVTVCPLCYEVKKVINMVSCEQTGKVGVVSNYCPTCFAAMNECKTCPKVKRSKR